MHAQQDDRHMHALSMHMYSALNHRDSVHLRPKIPRFGPKPVHIARHAIPGEHSHDTAHPTPLACSCITSRMRASGLALARAGACVMLARAHAHHARYTRYKRMHTPTQHTHMLTALEHGHVQKHSSACIPAPRAVAYGPAACGGTVPKRKASML